MSFSWQGAPQKRLAGTDAPRKLFADKWDLVLGFSSIYWWVLLAGGAQYHGGFLLHASLAEWITLQRAGGIWSRRGAFKQRQGTSEESGTGQQMEKRSCRRMGTNQGSEHWSSPHERFISVLQVQTDARVWVEAGISLKNKM